MYRALGCLQPRSLFCEWWSRSAGPSVQSLLECTALLMLVFSMPDSFCWDPFFSSSESEVVTEALLSTGSNSESKSDSQVSSLLLSSVMWRFWMASSLVYVFLRHGVQVRLALGALYWYNSGKVLVWQWSGTVVASCTSDTGLMAALVTLGQMLTLYWWHWDRCCYLHWLHYWCGGETGTDVVYTGDTVLVWWWLGTVVTVTLGQMLILHCWH